MNTALELAPDAASLGRGLRAPQPQVAEACLQFLVVTQLWSLSSVRTVLLSCWLFLRWQRMGYLKSYVYKPVISEATA